MHSVSRLLYPRPKRECTGLQVITSSPPDRRSSELTRFSAESSQRRLETTVVVVTAQFQGAELLYRAPSKLVWVAGNVRLGMLVVHAPAYSRAKSLKRNATGYVF